MTSRLSLALTLVLVAPAAARAGGSFCIGECHEGFDLGVGSGLQLPPSALHATPGNAFAAVGGRSDLLFFSLEALTNMRDFGKYLELRPIVGAKPQSLPIYVQMLIAAMDLRRKWRFGIGAGAGYLYSLDEDFGFFGDLGVLWEPGRQTQNLEARVGVRAGY